MSKVLTSSDLIRSIKRRAMIPSDQNTFTDADFLEMLNEEIQYFGIPHLMRTYEEYLLTSQDFALDGKREFEIPYRAIGNKLRELSYVADPAENPNDPDFEEDVSELSRISVEDLPDYNSYYSSRYTGAFYLKNNKVVLLGEAPDSESVLRMHFYLRPNSLVDENRVGEITAIDTSTGVVTLSSFPSIFSNLTEMDFVKHQSPNIILGYDIQPTSVNSVTKTVTFTASDLPDNLQVGDYLTLKQETIVPQLPVELHAILAQRVAVAALEALGDQEGLAAAQARLTQMEKSSNTIIDNRVEGAPEKINNRHGPLRQATLSSRRKGRF